MLFEGHVNSEILQTFLKAGAAISGEGFYGALVNNSSYDDIISILETNKSLAYTPIMYNEKKYHPFFVSGYTYVERPIYPLACILNFDWSIYKSQKCKKPKKGVLIL